MAIRSIMAFVAVAVCLFGPQGRAADRYVRLWYPPPVSKKIASMPRVLDPGDAAERRINSALERLDATVRKAAHDMKDPDDKPCYWARTVDVPMRGPGYISFVITDEIDCHGTHPNESTMAIVYDLRSGMPVNWTQLLPASLTGTMALQEGVDGTRMVTLASQRLSELYLAGYGAGRGPKIDPDCEQAIKDYVSKDAPRAMMAWLDAENGGLAVQFDLPHVVQACAVPVVIPFTTLGAEGAQSALVDAVQKAQQLWRTTDPPH